MAKNYLKTHILLRRGTSQEWEEVNPILQAGQMGVAIDLKKCKVGDGGTHWRDLPYFALESDLANKTSFIIKSYSDWQQEGYKISKQGQFYLYFPDHEGQDIKMKIGDGLAYIVDLPFVTDFLENTITTHINDGVIHISSAERSYWNSKVSVGVDSENQDNNLLFII